MSLQRLVVLDHEEAKTTRASDCFSMGDDKSLQAFELGNDMM